MIKKPIYLLITLCILSVIAYSQDTPGITSGGTENDAGYSIALTKDGGAIIAGKTRSYGYGCNDVSLIKLNQHYQIIWSVIIGDEYQNTARSIIEVDDGYIVSGETWSNTHGSPGIYLFKVDYNGEILFEKTFGLNSLDNCFDVIETSSGNLLLVGYTRTIDKYGGVYLIMTDSLGNKIWDQIYGFEYDEYAFEVLEDDENNFWIIGSRDGFFDDVHANFKTHDADIWLLKIDTNGNELESKIYGANSHDFGNSITKASDGGYFLFGSSQSYGAGSFDMMLTKIDNEGNEEWFTTYGGENFEYGMSIDRNIEGNLFMLGTTKSYGMDGSSDIYLIKSDELGNEIWTTIIGGSKRETGQQVIATNDSGCIVVGTTRSYGLGGDDIFFTKIGANGDIEVFANSNELLADEYVIAPNPVHDQGKVILHEGINDDHQLELISISGIDVGVFNISSNNPYFDATFLPKGIYIYKLKNTSTNKQVNGKLIIN